MSDHANPQGSEPRGASPESLAALLLEPVEGQPAEAAGERMLTARLRDAGDESPSVSEPGEEETPFEATADENQPEGEPDEQPEHATRTFTVKVDGKDMQVDEAELIAGYQRQADYTRKTQEVAEARRHVEADFRQIAETRNELGRKLQAIDMLVRHSLMQEPDWQRLAQDDPDAYARERRAWDAKVRSIQIALAQRDAMEAELGEQDLQDLDRRIDAEWDKTLALIPEWRDETVADAERQAVANYLFQAGFSKEEMERSVDGRAVAIARKAMLYDRLMARKPEVERKVAAAAKMVRPGAAADRQTGRTEREKALKTKLARSGRIEDAAALILMG